MNALVLTAGLGTRLDPLTRLVAKAAVPLGGRTLVERALLWLRGQGVRTAVLNLHHRPETITSVLGDGAHLGLALRYSWEQSVLGSAGGPRHALDLLDSDPFLIVNGDTLCDAPIAPMAAAHARTGADVTMALVPNPAPGHYNGVRLDAEDRVVEFVPAGPAAEGTWHFIGIQIAKRSVFEPLPDGVPSETVRGLYRERLKAAPGSLRGWRLALPFVDVGTMSDYLRAALSVGASGPGGSAIEDGARVDASATVLRSSVWAGATIGAGAHLDGCIVAGAVTIPAGLRAREAAIVPAGVARAGDAATIRDGVAVFPLESR